MTDTTAWQQATALRDAPERLFALRAAPLPEGMTALIRLASTDGPEADTAGAYLQAVCLYAGSPPWRCLGLAPGADPALAKEHHRLLIKWLHPDRNPQARVLAERVNAAWQALKAGALPVPVPRHAPPPMPPRARSRFPLFLAGLLAAGVLLLALSWWPQDQVYPESALPGPLVSAGEGAAATAPHGLPLWAPEPAAVAGVKASTAPAPAAAPVEAARAVSAAVVSAPAGPAMRAPEPPAPPISAPQASIVVEPVALMATEPNARAPARAQGEALLREFEQRYADGDLAAFMALFSADASNGRGDVADIRRDYRRLFQRTRRRDIVFSQARWRPGDDTLSVRLRYRAELGYGGGRAPAAQHGGLELALALEDGRPRIVQYLLLE